MLILKKTLTWLTRQSPRTILPRIIITLCLVLPVAFGTTQVIPEKGIEPVTLTRLQDGPTLLMVPSPGSSGVVLSLAFRAGAWAQTKEQAGIHALMQSLLQKADPGILIETGTSATVFSIVANSQDVELALTRLVSLVSPSTVTRLASDAVLLKEAIETASTRSTPTTTEKIMESALVTKLFSRAPWRAQPEGPPSTLAKLGKNELVNLAADWYVSGEALLIIGGDFDPANLLPVVKTSLAALEPGKIPNTKTLPALPRPGVTRPTWLAVPDPDLPAGLATLGLYYRGPDPQTSMADARIAYLWAALSSDPAGAYAKALSKSAKGYKGPGTPSGGPLARYTPAPATSILSVHATVQSNSAATTSQLFKETARGVELYTMKIKSAYFTKEEYARAASSLEGSRARLLGSASVPETALPAHRELASVWGNGMLEDFTTPSGEPSGTRNPGYRELSAFIDTYFMKNLEVILLVMNSEEFSKQRSSLVKAGFETPESTTASWWGKK